MSIVENANSLVKAGSDFTTGLFDILSRLKDISPNRFNGFIRKNRQNLDESAGKLEWNSVNKTVTLKKPSGNITYYIDNFKKYIDRNIEIEIEVDEAGFYFFYLNKDEEIKLSKNPNNNVIEDIYLRNTIIAILLIDTNLQEIGFYDLRYSFATHSEDIYRMLLASGNRREGIYEDIKFDNVDLEVNFSSGIFSIADRDIFVNSTNSFLKLQKIDKYKIINNIELSNNSNLFLTHFIAIQNTVIAIFGGEYENEELANNNLDKDIENNTLYFRERVPSFLLGSLISDSSKNISFIKSSGGGGGVNCPKLEDIAELFENKIKDLISDGYLGGGTSTEAPNWYILDNQELEIQKDEVGYFGIVQGVEVVGKTRILGIGKYPIYTDNIGNRVEFGLENDLWIGQKVRVEFTVEWTGGETMWDRETIDIVEDENGRLHGDISDSVEVAGKVSIKAFAITTKDKIQDAIVEENIGNRVYFKSGVIDGNRVMVEFLKKV